MKDYINLIPSEFKVKNWLSKEILVISGIAVIIVIFGILNGSMYYKAYSLKTEKGQLIDKREKVSKELTAILSQIENLTAKGGAVKDKGSEYLNLRDVTKGRIIWSSVLREISFLVSNDVWITTIESRKKKESEIKEVHFAGSALSHADVTNFIAALEKSDSFTNVTLNFAQQSELPNKAVVNFDMAAELKKAK